MQKLDYNYHYKKWHSNSQEAIDREVNFYASLLRPYINNIKHRSLLDVGCGTGLALLAAKKLGVADVCGVDIDPLQSQTAQSRGLDVVCAEDTVDFLDKNRAQFDIILCMDVIEHIECSLQLPFTQAIYRKIKPGGDFLCTVPNANSTLAMRWRYIDFTHCSSFTEHSLDFLLHNTGFVDIAVTSMEFLSRPKFWYLPIAGSRHWWAFCFFRWLRRLQVMAELGPQVGRKVPLSLNLLAYAKK
jgi:SAM-dependent methyltransferase